MFAPLPEDGGGGESGRADISFDVIIFTDTSAHTTLYDTGTMPPSILTKEY
jgi:hypothetical protein